MFESPLLGADDTYKVNQMGLGFKLEDVRRPVDIDTQYQSVLLKLELQHAVRFKISGCCVVGGFGISKRKLNL